MKRVIITGGTGFIGRQAISHLLARGYHVCSVARGSIPPDLELVRDRFPKQFQHTALDLLNTRATKDLLEKIRASHLLHLAWDTRHGVFWTSPENRLWLNASCSLIEAFIGGGGARVVAAGTCAEYEWGPRHLNEASSLLRPTTPYGECKLALRNFLIQRRIRDAVSSAWGRVFHLFGPYEYEQRLVASACRSLLRSEPFQATHGAQIRDFSSVLDVAAGFVALLDSEVTGDVNIASGEAWSIGSVLSELGRLAKRPELIKLGVLSPPPHDPPCILADTGRLVEEVGFSPVCSVAQRLAETFDWWHARGAY